MKRNLILLRLASWLPTAASIMVLTSARLQATEPADGRTIPAKQIAGLKVYPPQAKLPFADDTQAVIVQAELQDGSTLDVTSQVRWDGQNSEVAVLSKGMIHPTRAGASVWRGTFEGVSCELPIEVVDGETTRALTFRNDVLPVLTKTGCNSGKCHGAASGKDGFRLSLYGFDPEGDYFRIMQEMSGRRVNLAQPQDSLLVQKALGEVPHTGGALMDLGDPNYVTLLRWLASGASADPREMPLPVGIEVFPSRSVMPQPGCAQQMVVMAKYDDGSVRDVTSLSVFLSNNDAAATVSESGRIEGVGPGTAFMLARFDQFTSGTSVVVRSGKPFPEVEFEPANYIDSLALERWRDLHLLPSQVASDEVFLRRVTLDLTGRLPTLEQWQAFVADPSADKRSRLVESLVGTDDFLDMWIMKVAELLQVRRANGLSPKGLSLYDSWLRDQVHAGVTIDELVQQIIPASGSTFENPAANYYQTETTPQLLAENMAQAFLGTRIQCAQCHNHPFDRWTMDDYYGFAAFVSQVGYKQAKDPREITVFDLGEGSLEHPVAGREIRPKYLGGDFADLGADVDSRQLLAQWLTEQNTAFAENVANILWAHFFGVGIVNPVDDVRVSNPPSNRALLSELGRRLQAYDFDVRRLAQDICNSKTYQLSTQTNEWNAWDDRDFSHAMVRRLRAEVLLDCVNQVTLTTDELAGLPLGGRAIQIPDGNSNNYFLETFGRADRETPCSCEVSTAPTLSQALHLLNGENTNAKIERGGRIEQWLKAGMSSQEVARQLYLVCLSRLPSPEEESRIASKLTSAADEVMELKDLFWALLNSNEFLFNH